MFSRILIFLSLLMFSIPANAAEFSKAPVNPAFLQWIQNHKNDGDKNKASMKSSSGAGDKSNHSVGGDIPSPLDRRHLNGSFGTRIKSKKTKNSKKPSMGAAPLECSVGDSVCDMRSMDYLSGIRYQTHGNCWAYATYSSLEANLRKDFEEDWDFSEDHMGLYHGFDWDIEDGGNYDMAVAYLSRWAGPTGGANQNARVEKHLQNTMVVPPVREAYYGVGGDPLYIENVKKALVNYGPVFIIISAQSRFFTNGNNSNPHFYAYDCTKPRGENFGSCSGEGKEGHAISIVGWDDTMPASDFTMYEETSEGTVAHTPAGNGAFIIRNSWGKGNGDSGYYYISYYDTSIGGSTAVFDTPEPVDNYDGVYSHDKFGVVSAMGYDNDIGWGANVFRAESDTYIKAVSFYALDVREKYEAYIYTGLSDTNNPVSGTRHMVSSGTLENAGYYTVRAESPILIHQGEYFSVVMKYDTSEGGYPYNIPTENNYPNYLSSVVVNERESFISHNGTSWTDAYTEADPFHIPIKVFTEGDPTPPVWPESPSVELNDLPVDGQSLTANWTAAEDSDTSVIGYIIAVGNSSGYDDVVNWTDVGNVTSITMPLSLRFGDTYYVGVRAYNVTHTTMTADNAIWSEGKRYWFMRPNPPSDVKDGSVLGVDIEFIASTMTISASWNESEAGDGETTSSAESYWYAIGTGLDNENGASISSQIPGNVDGWINNGSELSFTLDLAAHDVYLAHGQKYYVSVKAKDSSGYFSEIASSNGQTVDTTIPRIENIVVESPHGFDPSYSVYGSSVVSTGTLHGYVVINERWDWLDGSPKIYLSLNDAQIDISDGLRSDDPDHNLSLWNFSVSLPPEQANKTASITFSAKTKAGNASVGEISEESEFGSTFLIRRTAVIDLTPPLWGEAHARDGLSRIDDIEELDMPEYLSANWDSAYDDETPIYYYEYSIGTSTGSTDVKDWTENGLETSVSVPVVGLHLEYGRTYYFNIRAVNMAELTSSDIISTNGQKIKNDPTGIGYLYCAGESDEDTGYVNWESTFAAHWTTSESDIPEDLRATGYKFAIGTTYGGTEISSGLAGNDSGWIDIGNVLHAEASEIEPGLLDNTDYYFSVKAYNAHGGESDPKICRTHTLRTPASITSIIWNENGNYHYDSVDGKNVVSFGDVEGSFILDKPQDAIAGSPVLSFEDSASSSTVLQVTPDENDNMKWHFSGTVSGSVALGTASLSYGSETKAGLSGSDIASAYSTFEIRKSIVEDHVPPYWPAGAAVIDGNGAEDISEVDTETELSASWTAAQDSLTAIDHYEYSILNAGDDSVILAWTSTSATNVTATGLGLTLGDIYYFKVRAYDLIGNISAELSSDGQRVRNEPGNIPAAYCSPEGTGFEYVNWASSFSAHWDASTETFPYRAAIGYRYAVGTSAGLDDIYSWSDTGSAETRQASVSGISLQDDTDYYFSVKAYNAHGGESSITSCRTHTLRTAPEIVSITLEGTNYNYDETADKKVVSFGSIQGSLTIDKPYETIEGVPSLSFTDSGSTVSNLTVEADPSNIYKWNFTGTVPDNAALGEATFSYFGRTKAGMISNTVPDGNSFEIRKSTVADYNAPYWPAEAVVRDGLEMSDIGSVSPEDDLSANWDDAVDDETVIDYYEYSIGSDPGLKDILDWTRIEGKSVSVSQSGLAVEAGHTYYFNVRAYDLLANVSAVLSSDGQNINSKPGRIPYVNCVQEGTGNGYAHWISSFSANWGASLDNVSESLRATQYMYSIGTFADSSDVLDWQTVSAENLSAAIEGLELSERTYHFNVKALNAYSESEINKCSVTIDRTPPFISSMEYESEQKAGNQMSGSFELSEKAAAMQNVALYFRTEGSSELHPLVVSRADGDKKWNFTGYIELNASFAGTAEFVLSATDKAGNHGDVINGQRTFTIDVMKNVSDEDAVFINDDGDSVTVPAGTVDGLISISITEPVGEDAAAISAADNASPDMRSITQRDAVRNFKAFDGNGDPLSQFANGVEIAFSYSDTDGDGILDGDEVPVSSLYICYLDEAKGKWIPMLNTVRDKAGRKISVNVNHFSIFSLKIIKGLSQSFMAKPSPTPCRFYNGETLDFKDIPAGATGIRIYIYNTVGELVRELAQDETVWDGKTKNGSKAASGMYIYLVKTDSHGISKGKTYIMW